MSTRSSIFYVEIHLYKELLDQKVHLEVDGRDSILNLELPDDTSKPANIETLLFNYVRSLLK